MLSEAYLANLKEHRGYSEPRLPLGPQDHRPACAQRRVQP